MCDQIQTINVHSNDIRLTLQFVTAVRISKIVYLPSEKFENHGHLAI